MLNKPGESTESRCGEGGRRERCNVRTLHNNAVLVFGCCFCLHTDTLKELWITNLLPEGRKLKTMKQVSEVCILWMQAS